MGLHAWQTVHVMMELPPGIDYLEVGSMHHAGGRTPAY